MGRLRVAKAQVVMTAIAAAMSMTLAAQSFDPAPNSLPVAARTKLAESLKASAPHTRHVWRDTPPVNADGTINGYIEIARGDRRKFEHNMAKNTLEIDRIIPEKIGSYPINYGFVPQTVSYDGDPFDVLVLGPPLQGGTIVQGVAVGTMYMEDEKGSDSKVVISPLGADGRPSFALTDAIKKDVGEFFRRYKLDQPGLFSRVPGWGSAEEGRTLVRLTHRFFLDCRQETASPCVVNLR